jgi:hypothetical protein
MPNEIIDFSRAFLSVLNFLRQRYRSEGRKEEERRHRDKGRYYESIKELWHLGIA